MISCLADVHALLVDDSNVRHDVVIIYRKEDVLLSVTTMSCVPIAESGLLVLIAITNAPWSDRILIFSRIIKVGCTGR